MRWRYLAWAVVVLSAIGFAAVMIPGSPFSLERTIGDPVSGDPPRPLRQWTADLASPDRAVRLAALEAIDRIAPLSARAALPVAKLIPDDPDPEIRELASHVLRRIGTGAKPALPVATAALSADSPAVRRNAALFMLGMKTEARPAVPALIAAMNDPQNDLTLGHTETVQAVAASALGVASAGTPDAVPALTAVVESDRPLLLRAAAARSLGVIGPPARPAIPAMTALLAVKDWDVREDVTVALRALGEKPPDVNRPTISPAEYARKLKDAGDQSPRGGPPKGAEAPKQGGPEVGPEPAPPPKPKGG